MKLEKAIEILSQHQIDLRTPADHDFFAAILLGSEALKARQQVVHDYPHLPWQPLPGETP